MTAFLPFLERLAILKLTNKDPVAAWFVVTGDGVREMIERLCFAR
jgi:hypothetical protein